LKGAAFDELLETDRQTDRRWSLLLLKEIQYNSTSRRLSGSDWPFW